MDAFLTSLMTVFLFSSFSSGGLVRLSRQKKRALLWKWVNFSLWWFPYIFDVMEYVVWQWPFATEGSFVGTKVKVSGTTDMVILQVTYNLWSLWSQVVCLTPLQVFNTSGLPLLTWKTRSCLSWPKYFDRCVVEVVDSENSTFCSQANLRRKKET